MKTSILVLIALASLSCGPGVESPLGNVDVSVSIVDCLPPYTSWARDEIESFGWHVSDAGTVEVQCADTGDKGGSGEYELGSGRVLIDPVKAPGEFSTRAAVGHELVHWLIYNGPHPELATVHICDVAYNESYPPGCAVGLSSKNALMSPGGTADWDGDQETFSFTSVREYRVTDADRQLIERALTP